MRLIARAVLVASVTLIALLEGAAAASEPRGLAIGGREGTCVQYAAGSVTVAAGGLTAPRDYSADGTARDFFCEMPDPSIHSATEVWSQTGTLTCVPLGQTALGTDTVTWSNGRKSVLAYHDHAVGNLDDTRGLVTRGEFIGMHVHFVGPVSFDPSDPAGTVTGAARACGLQQATTVPLFYLGLGRFT